MPAARSSLCVRSDQVQRPCNVQPLSTNPLRNGTKTRDSTKNRKIQGERPNQPGPQAYQHRAGWLVPAPPSIAAAGSSGRSKCSSHPGCLPSSKLLTGPQLRNVHVGPIGSIASHIHPDRGIDKVVASVSLTCKHITDPHADSPGNGVNLGHQSPSCKVEKDWQNSHC